TFSMPKKIQARYLVCDCFTPPLFLWVCWAVLPGVSAAVCCRLSLRSFCRLASVFHHFMPA
ncbi:MAG TPA: hypothetical protein DCM34_13310, partial [Salmonella bongori]|nr:hypothetical protein [Salmonella bongori]